jgi:hypothetical protein
MGRRTAEMRVIGTGGPGESRSPEAGEGAAVGPDGGESLVSPGDYVFVPSNETHNVKNTGTRPFEFICIVPGRGEPPT